MFYKSFLWQPWCLALLLETCVQPQGLLGTQSAPCHRCRYSGTNPTILPVPSWAPAELCTLLSSVGWAGKEAQMRPRDSTGKACEGVSAPWLLLSLEILEAAALCNVLFRSCLLIIGRGLEISAGAIRLSQ